MLLNSVVREIAKSGEAGLIEQFQQVLSDFFDRYEKGAQAKIQHTGLFTIDYNGNGAYRKRTIKPNDGVTLTYTGVRIGKSGLIVQFAPTDFNSAYKISSNMEWRLETLMGDKAYNLLEGELIDNLNSALMGFVMDDAFDLVAPKMVAEKLIEKLLGVKKPGEAKRSYEDLLNEYKDTDNFGDFA